MLRLNKKINQVDIKILRHHKKYKTVMLSVQSLKQMQPENQSTSKVKFKKKRSGQVLHSIVIKIPILQQLTRKISQRQLDVSQKNLSNLLHYSKNKPHSFKSERNHHQFKICHSKYPLSLQEFNRREQHLQSIIHKEKQLYKGNRNIRPTTNENSIRRTFSCITLKSPRSSMLKEMPMSAINICRPQQLSKQLIPLMFRSARQPRPGPLQTRLSDDFDWSFEGRQRLFMIDTESFAFCEIKDVIRRGRYLYRLQQAEPSQMITLNKFYKHVNHIFFYEEKGTISKLVACFLLGTDLEYQSFYYQGVFHKQLIQAQLQAFFGQLLRIYTDGRLFRTDVSIPLTRQREAELQGMKKLGRSKLVIVQNMRGLFQVVPLFQ